MVFDAEKHKVNLVLIRCGKHLFPDEINDTELLRMAADLLGIAPERLTSAQADHLPSPKESGPFGDCPECGRKTLTILPICSTCEKAQGGKNKTEFVCVNDECKHTELSPLFLIQAYKKFGIEIPEGFKVDLGIKTVTDQGLK